MVKVVKVHFFIFSTVLDRICARFTGLGTN